MNHKVDFGTLRRCVYRAVSWSFLILRHISQLMLLGPHDKNCKEFHSCGKNYTSCLINTDMIFVYSGFTMPFKSSRFTVAFFSFIFHTFITCLFEFNICITHAVNLSFFSKQVLGNDGIFSQHSRLCNCRCCNNGKSI